MSYEGYTEFLCACGHYLAVDCHSESPETCPNMECSARMAWFHVVDETNGIDERVVRTVPALKDLVGFSEFPRVDHLGNCFFVKVDRYAPAQDSGWMPVPSDEEMSSYEFEYAMRLQRFEATFMQHADKFRIFEGEVLISVCESESEFDARYESFLEDGKMNLMGFYPHDSN